MNSFNSFIPPGRLTKAVLLLVFNRPAMTSRIFEEIRRAGPSRLYIAADGPRQNSEEDIEKCRQVREIVSMVDWDCKVSKLFHDENLGCRVAVSTAIDWFFEHEQDGIILEDDCLPVQSFFWFCEELLNRYRDNTRIMQICGSNFFENLSGSKNSYFFSKNGPIWGWASWRRAWKYYDVKMTHWPELKEKNTFHDSCDSKKERKFRQGIYDKVFSGEIDTWDYQWGFAKLINSGLSIVPSINLISNIGFGDKATHINDADSPFANMRTSDIIFPLHPPDSAERDYVYDKKFFNCFVTRSYIQTVLLEIVSFIKKIVKS